MKTLLSCDAVFERLTRGPFPSGAAEDHGVEQHLEACHECRQLAEALRPAVNLFHDVAEQATLPAYRGRLPQATASPTRSSLPGLPSSALETRRSLVDIRYAMVLAAVLLLGFIGGAYGSRWSGGGEKRPSSEQAMAAWRVGGAPEEVRLTADVGRLAWSLSLPNACRSGLSGASDAAAEDPSSDRPEKPTWRVNQHCCTLCHSAQSPRSTQFAASRFVAACLLCHKG